MANEKYLSYSKASVEKIERYIGNGFNVLLEGKHGVGKTQMVKQACKNLGYNVVTFNAALMDSFIDLRGVPFSKENGDGDLILEMVRQENVLNDADVIFYDEIGRAQVAELNAIMNTINEHSVNGEVLPRLKAVVGATNTGREYSSFELDAAQKDRFDVFFSCSAYADQAYFQTLFDDDFAKALVDWQNNIISNIDSGTSGGDTSSYISPRSLEKIGHMFKAFNDEESIRDALGEVQEFVTVNELYENLSNSCMTTEEIYESMSDLSAGELNHRISWMIPKIVSKQDEHIKAITSISDESLKKKIMAQFKFLAASKHSLSKKSKLEEGDITEFINFSKELVEANNSEKEAA